MTVRVAQIRPSNSLRVVFRDLDHVAGSLLNAAMTGLTRRMHRVLQVFQVRLQARLEQRLHLAVQARRIPLQGQHVMPLLLADLRSNLLLATHRIDRHRAAFQN